MIRSAAELRHAEHDALEAKYQAWLAAGNVPEVVPIGAGVDALLTPYQRINPDVRTRATIEAQERAAKKAQSVSGGTMTPKEPRTPKPRVRKAGPAKVRVKNGPDFAQPGTQKGEILNLLRSGPLRSDEIASRLGMKVQIARANLHVLKRRRVIATSGPARALLWQVAA